MILCTQRPDAEIIEGQAKSNMGATLAFRTRDAIQSQILLGPGDVTASQIPAGIPGRGIWKWIDSGIQVQTPLLEVDRARELLAGVKRTPADANSPAAPRDVEIKPCRPEVGYVEGVRTKSDEREPARNGAADEPATFDVTRLAVGRRYEFTLTDGRTVVGVLWALEAPNPDDGAPAMWVCDQSGNHHLNHNRVVSRRRSSGSG